MKIVSKGGCLNYTAAFHVTLKNTVLAAFKSTMYDRSSCVTKDSTACFLPPCPAQNRGVVWQLAVVGTNVAGEHLESWASPPRGTAPSVAPVWHCLKCGPSAVWQCPEPREITPFPHTSCTPTHTPRLCPEKFLNFLPFTSFLAHFKFNMILNCNISNLNFYISNLDFLWRNCCQGRIISGFIGAFFPRAF